MTFILMIIFGLMDSCRAIYFSHFVRYSAERAARYAMVRGATWKNASCSTVSTASCTVTSQDVERLVKSLTPVGDLNNLIVVTTWTGKTPSGAACSTPANSPGCVVQVNVTYNFDFVLPFLPKNTVVIASKAAVPIAQ